MPCVHFTLNPTADSYTVDLNTAGAGKVDPNGTETVLTSADPMDENSLDNPTKFKPVTREITGLGASFSYTFKPWSFTILRLKAESLH